MILQAIILTRIRFTLDVSAIVTLSCYSLIITCRAVLWFIYIFTNLAPDEEGEGKAAVNLIDLAGYIMIWLVLYFFIFEMRIVQNKL